MESEKKKIKNKNTSFKKNRNFKKLNNDFLVLNNKKNKKYKINKQNFKKQIKIKLKIEKEALKKKKREERIARRKTKMEKIKELKRIRKLKRMERKKKLMELIRQKRINKRLKRKARLEKLRKLKKEVRERKRKRKLAKLQVLKELRKKRRAKRMARKRKLMALLKLRRLKKKLKRKKKLAKLLAIKKEKFRKKMMKIKKKGKKKYKRKEKKLKITRKKLKKVFKNKIESKIKNFADSSLLKSEDLENKKEKGITASHNFPLKSFFKAKIKVIGIGGGGGSIVSEMGRSLNKASFIVADTDLRSFKKKEGIKYFLFGQDLTHGLGTGINPELGKQAALQEKEKIAKFFEGQDIVIFVASLGGGVGSGATQIFAQAAQNFNGITLGIFTLPFKFEGKNKQKIAAKSLVYLRKMLNVSITIPNEKIFKIIDNNTPVTQAFSVINKNLIESLESLIDLIYSPGIINIDFADIKTILKGKGNLAFLNTAEASGENRVAEIIKKILHNPLYQSNNFIADKILFNIIGGADISMFEIDKISRAISEKNPKAKIIFGISKNQKFKQKIKTIILMTGYGSDKISEKEEEELKVSSKILREGEIKRTDLVLKQRKQSFKKKKLVKIGEKFKFIPAVHQDSLIKKKNIASPVFSSSIEELNSQNGSKKLEIFEAQVKNISGGINVKKTIRRSALEIKQAERDREENQTLQEKEWEIPAFLRMKNKNNS